MANLICGCRNSVGRVPILECKGVHFIEKRSEVVNWELAMWDSALDVLVLWFYKLRKKRVVYTDLGLLHFWNHVELIGGELLAPTLTLQ